MYERRNATLLTAICSFMVTESIASSLQGESRSTPDIDVVASIREEDVQRLIDAFLRPHVHIDADAARGAVAHQSMFDRN